ncbi:serine carboxypeptidase-like 45 isoform X2 [Trifolium pratense]|uniref:serine carboxypeptidase-like 45 isoform X2 n=1 Tax=Trifolium pratense TaxID=57577 RepID=UPI001E692AC4|nr:serine carboxypeptidase-like 45 isoform X2 [Trifolium pratense]
MSTPPPPPLIFCLIIFFLSLLLRLHSAFEFDKVTRLPNQPKVEFNQFAGYITIDDTRDNQKALYYYFVEAEVDATSKPVVLWLNGGPGCSSVGVGAFQEHGPFQPTKEGHLLRNPFSWNREANMIYLDSPVGVGFSFSANTTYYFLLNDRMAGLFLFSFYLLIFFCNLINLNNQYDILTNSFLYIHIARDNLLFLEGWFNKFPSYRNNEFFITGESYAGHFAPQLAHLIIQTKSKINLKGIAIGNPLLEFNTDFSSTAEFLWSHGQISKSTFEMLKSVCSYAEIQRQSINFTLSTACAKVNLLVQTEVTAYTDAFDVIVDVCLPSKKQQSSMLTHHLYAGKGTCSAEETARYFNRKEVQQALHAHLQEGVTNWSTCSHGDQDSVIPFIGTQWRFKTRRAQTTPVGGWTQVYGGKLSFATIRGAGHATSSTQPGRSLVLFKYFLKGTPLPYIH